MASANKGGWQEFDNDIGDFSRIFERFRLTFESYDNDNCKHRSLKVWLY